VSATVKDALAPAAIPTVVPALLAARDVACRRGGRLLAEGLDLELAAGDLLLIRGANGSGKSSLLRLLAGLLPPAHGALYWAGEPVAADPAAHRSRLHLVTVAQPLKAALSARQNLAFIRGMLGGRAGLRAALDGMGALALEQTAVRFLSTGQCRRVSLARLLAVPRPCWLLDEPETGLDGEGRSGLLELIAEQRAAGGIVAVASHADLPWRPSLLLEL
jgi:heme exporter protein A